MLAVHLHHHLHGPRLDYVGIGVAAALSWIGLPGPGEAALIGAGIAASRGKLDLGEVVVIAWVGATVGGLGGWLIGRYGGRRLVLAGRRLRRVRERALERGNRFFERFGWVAVYFAPSWVAGINSMSAARFLAANGVCALAWSLLVGVGAYAVGPSIRDVVNDIGIFGALAIAAAGVVAAVLAGRAYRRRARA